MRRPIRMRVRTMIGMLRLRGLNILVYPLVFPRIYPRMYPRVDRTTTPPQPVLVQLTTSMIRTSTISVEACPRYLRLMDRMRHRCPTSRHEQLGTLCNQHNNQGKVSRAKVKLGCLSFARVYHHRTEIPLTFHLTQLHTAHRYTTVHTPYLSLTHIHSVPHQISHPKVHANVFPVFRPSRAVCSNVILFGCYPRIVAPSCTPV